MQNAFDQPDVELMLRGTPDDLHAVRFRVIPPEQSPKSRRKPWFAAVRRGRPMMLGLAIAGALGGFWYSQLRPPMYVAVNSLAITGNLSAETVIRRAQAQYLAGEVASQ